MKPGNDPDNKPTAPDLANPEKTSPNIGLSLSNSSLEAAPGGTVDTVLRVQNLSNIVDRLRLKIDGLDPTWWSLSVPTLSFFPGDKGESRLTIKPPKEAEAMAGSYSFRVRAVSEANPGDETVVAGVLLLRGFVVCDVEMSPAKVAGRSGSYRLTARNSGNTDAVLHLEGKDPEEALAFAFDRDKVTVPAGGTSQVQLTVSPKTADEHKTYYFQVTSNTVAPSKQVKMLNGQLEYLPRVKRPWWPMALIIAGGVLVVLGIVAGLYQRTSTEYLVYSTTTTPFRAFMIPLIAAGVVLLGAGFWATRRKKSGTKLYGI